MIELETAKAAAGPREQRFAEIDEMREVFKDVPREEIERNGVTIIREMREVS